MPPIVSKLTSSARLLSSLEKGRRIHSTLAQAKNSNNQQASGIENHDTLAHLRSVVLSGILEPYLVANPTSEAAIATIEASLPQAEIGFDHYAFRTFNVEHLGIQSIAKWILDLGYVEQRDELLFPEKKLRALWYSPPDDILPRIFISELKVEELSPKAQNIIYKYTRDASLVSKFSLITGVIGMQPWQTPTYDDFQTLAAESEYAAWVLTNGYSLNHTTIAVHRLAGLKGGIEALNQFLIEQGFEMNKAGGVLKKSPDGLLLQSSTVADMREYCFADGDIHSIPGSYIEFAERLLLPEYADTLQPEEWMRRDGFEVGSADKIFESTNIKGK